MFSLKATTTISKCHSLYEIMRGADHDKEMLIALPLFLCFTSHADTWHDDTTGYTWTYFLVDGHAEIGADNGGYNWDYDSRECHRVVVRLHQ